MTGSTEVGKYANFTALNKNPLMIKDNQIKDIEILGTVLKGDAIPLN